MALTAVLARLVATILLVATPSWVVAVSPAILKATVPDPDWVRFASVSTWVPPVFEVVALISNRPAAAVTAPMASE